MPKLEDMKERNSKVNKEPSRQSILKLSASDAQLFFLKTESYCNFELPPYINFAPLLKKTDEFLKNKNLKGLSDKPREHNDVNYMILNNKDGRYSWRPFELIHPALYVSLVHRITNEESWGEIKRRFLELHASKNIYCLSMPVVSLSEEKDKAEQIKEWWHSIEQRSIELSLEYEYLLETDVTDCYGSVYTHSIPWALHEKDVAKKKTRDNSLIGNVIDGYIQDMRYGQTNGIPQGSVLMDFIAELVLGYADSELAKKIEEAKIKDFCILRYRDDYRVFVNNIQDGERIIKYLTEVMIDLGLRLSSEKTKNSNNVILSSIKHDKLAWLSRKNREKSLQKHLLIIYDHALEFPNAGSLIVALADFHKRIDSMAYTRERVMPLVAIAVDIAYRNPRTYAISSAILSKLISFITEHNDKLLVIEKIKKRFSKIPNTGHIQIWLQRFTYYIDKDIFYEEKICKLISSSDDSLWNIEWINSKDLKEVLETPIIDRKIIGKLDPVITHEEASMFATKRYA